MSLAEQSPAYFGPINGIYSNPEMLDPTYRTVVSPNSDTPYTVLHSDLRAEPLVLEMPEIDDRYYVIQLVDLYGYNAHYVGTRVTGTGAGKYLLAGPRWDGTVPEGITDVFRFETDLVVGIGRTQLLDAADLPKLKEVTARYKLEPLSAYEGKAAPAAEPYSWQMWDPTAVNDERFIGYLNELLTFCQPPHPDDEAVLASMATIGISPGMPFDADALTGDQRDAIRAGIAAAQAKMEERATRLSQKVNGWQSLTGFGDRAYFEGDYLLKAAAATVGYLANDREEADYPICRVDADGDPLNGRHTYRVTFTEQPPNDAFWSMTMYDTAMDGVGGFLVDNPIDRYLINSTTEGLVTADDGALVITLQHDEPTDPTERANWLPAPEGDFYLMLRIYMPTTAVLDGAWQPPAVVKVS